jgi:hypothetical protein
MRVLHLIYSFEKGGAERYCINVCTELASRENIEILLVCMSTKNQYSFLTDPLGYQICTSRIVPSISGKSKIDTKDFERIVAEFKPDIIHSHLFRAELLAHEVYFPGVKYVTHCHDNMVELNNFTWSKFHQKNTYTKLFEKRWMIKRYRR